MIPVRFPLIEPRPEDFATTRDYVHARNVYLKQIKDRDNMDNWNIAMFTFLAGFVVVVMVTMFLTLAYIAKGITGIVVLLSFVASSAWCIFEIKQYLDRKDQDNGS